MSTNENGFLFTPGELTLPPGARHDGSEHGGVAILISRVILDAEMSDPDKALTICGHLKAAGLETNESAIRVINLSKSDVGQTDHWAPMGGIGGCGEMSGGVEIVFYFHVVCASPPFLCAAWRRAIKKKSTQKRAGVSWWSCPGPRMTKGTRKIASKNPQEVDERENPSLLKRP